jgi:hypothetical protein
MTPPTVSFAQALRDIFPANGFAMRGEKFTTKTHRSMQRVLKLGQDQPPLRVR